MSLSCTLGPFLAVTGFAMNRSTLGAIVTHPIGASGTNLQTRFIVVAQSIGSLRIGHGIVAVTLLAFTVLRLCSRP